MIKKVSGPLILVRYAHLILDLEDDVLYTPAEVVQTKYGHKGSRSPEYQHFNRYRNAIWAFGDRGGIRSHSCDNAKRDENGKIIMRKDNGEEKVVLQEGERYPKAYGKTWREFLDPRERELPIILQNLHDILSQELDHRRANEIRESREEAGSSETKEPKIQDAQESRHRDTMDDSELMDMATEVILTPEIESIPALCSPPNQMNLMNENDKSVRRLKTRLLLFAASFLFAALYLITVSKWSIMHQSFPDYHQPTQLELSLEMHTFFRRRLEPEKESYVFTKTPPGWEEHCLTWGRSDIGFKQKKPMSMTILAFTMNHVHPQALHLEQDLW